MMKTGCTGTESPKNGTGGLRRVVLALAVLLLTCVLMAGAVSAEGTTAAVNNYDQLIEALADDTKSSITLTANIDATAEILVNRSVTIDGAGHKITAITDPWPTGNDKKHLLGIMKKTDATNDITVTLKNLKLDSASKAMGLNIFEPGGEITLTDLTLTNSAGSGITISGATVKASGLEISGSKWGQSIDVGLGTAEKVKTSSLTLSGTNTLSDVYQINTDNPDAVTVNAPGYKRYDWFYDYTDNSGYHSYAHHKSTWTTNPDFTAVHLPKEDENTKAPVLVLNNSAATPALHKDLVNATKYVEDSATIQLLGDVELKETAEIFNKVTLDLNGKTITRTDETALRLIGSNADVTLSDKSGKNTGTVKAVTTHPEESPWAVGVNVTQGKLTVDTGVTILASHMGIRTHGSQTDTPGYSKVTLNSGATINAAYGIYIYRNDTSTQNDPHAYGAVVDVYGTIECLDASDELKGWTSYGATGIFVDGNVQDQSGNLTQLHIYEGAKIIAKGAPAIAGNGMANITINGGTLTGDEALGVKSGNWIINGGTFTANGKYHNPAITDNSGTDATGAAVGVTTTYTGTISLTIRGGEFLSQNGDALSIFRIPGKDANVKNLVIEGGVFSTQNSSRLGMQFYNDIDNEPFTTDATISIIGGKYTPDMNSQKIVAPYEVIQDGAYKTVARIESSPTAEVKPEASGAQNVTVSAPGTSGELQLETTGATPAESVTLNVSGNTDVKLILHAKEGETLRIDETNNSVIGNVTKVTYIPNETVLQNTDNVSFKMHFNVQDLAKVLNGGIKIQVTNSPASGDYTGTYARAFSVTILSTDGAELHNTDVELGYTQKSGYTYKVIHAKEGRQNNVVFTYAGGKFKFIAPSFSSYVITETPTPASTSSGGSSAYSFRVLFNDGSTTLSVVTDLSYGDKLTKPETPVKDGYTFAGWYKDSACTQAWDFETGIPGDMTLYAKWTAAGSSGETEATTTPTATSTAVTTPQPTKTQSTTATTSAPQATTAAGVSPTLTQAPAPVAGALVGLSAAGVLLRRRCQ